MEIQLSDHFNYKRLMRFVLPSICMMIFTSVYGVVDGFFVSNFAGNVPFASINLIMPFIMVFASVGFMVGSGGTALVSKYLGEGNGEKARSVFSLLVYVTIAAGIVMTVLGEMFLSDVAIALGASKEMLPYCVTYGRISFITIGMYMLQNMFQSFMVVAERPKMGLFVTVLAGLTNMALDGILVGYFRLGVEGAAVATAISESIGALIPLLYFIFNKKLNIGLGKAVWDLKALVKTCTNGVSEFLTNISFSIVNMFYNMQLMYFAGENGVSAYGVIMYISFIFVAVFIGYSMGTAPLIGYNYGAENHAELKNLFSKSLKLMAAFGLLMSALGILLAGPFAALYVGYDQSLMELSRHALRIYSIGFFMVGFNIYGSGFFTALNNGLVSGLLSFMRLFVLSIAAVMLLPLAFGIEGVWFAPMTAEGIALIMTVSCWIVFRKRYKYA